MTYRLENGKWWRIEHKYQVVSEVPDGHLVTVVVMYPDGGVVEEHFISPGGSESHDLLRSSVEITEVMNRYTNDKDLPCPDGNEHWNEILSAAAELEAPSTCVPMPGGGPAIVDSAALGVHSLQKGVAASSGVQVVGNSTVGGNTSATQSGDKTVHVNAYKRKDGTPVRPHDRRLPGSGASQKTIK